MAAWLLVLQGHGDKVRCDRKTSLPSLPCCSYKNHEKHWRQDMDTNTRSDSLWLLPLPGAGRWLRLCLGLGGLGCGVGLELVLGRGDGLAGSSVGVAGGHQRGGHRLLCWSREDLQRAKLSGDRGQTLPGWGELLHCPARPGGCPPSRCAPSPAEHSTFSTACPPCSPQGEMLESSKGKGHKRHLGQASSNDILQWAQRTDKCFPCRLQRRCSSSQDGSLPHPKPAACPVESLESACQCSPPFFFRCLDD